MGTDDEPMNLLFVDITPTHGVANMDLTATLIELMRSGCHCNLCALKSALFRERLEGSPVQMHMINDLDWSNMWVRGEGINRDMPVRGFNWFYRRVLFSRFVRQITELAEQLLEEVRPALIHTNSFDFRLTPMIDAARRLGIPLVYSIRSYRRLVSTERNLLQTASLILPITQDVRDDLIGQAPKLEARTQVWHNGIPFEGTPARDHRAAVRAEYQIPEDHTVVSIVGRIAPYRGTEHYVDAMIPVLKERPDVTGVIMGRIGYRERNLLSALISKSERALGRGRLHFILDRKWEDAFVAASDILVHANIYSDPKQGLVEAISRDVLLALRYGVTVVTTDAGHAGTIIRDGKTGLVVPTEDTEAIRQAVTRLVGDPQTARALGESGRRYAHAEHNSATRATELLELYRTHVLS